MIFWIFFRKGRKLPIFLPSLSNIELYRNGNEIAKKIKGSLPHAFLTCVTAVCCCVFKEITLVASNQRNYLENTNAFSKRKLKTRVATRIKRTLL